MKINDNASTEPTNVAAKLYYSPHHFFYLSI